MGKTVSITFKDGKPASRLKDPKERAEAEEVGRAFLEWPGAVVVVPNPDLPEEVKGAASWLLRRYCR